MGASHPHLARKLRTYMVAPSPHDRLLLRRIAAARDSGRRALRDSNLIWIGRWAAHKGTEELLSFLTHLFRDNLTARVTIAGCGRLTSEVRDVLDLASRRLQVVEGFERSELPGLLAAHDAGLFTSRVEGWGLSIQEMLESGMPVFATHQGAVEDLASWFPSQLSAFPPPLDAVLSGPEPEQSFERYAGKFEWESIARKYVESVSD